MTRVSEGSTFHTVTNTSNRTKAKLEDLQTKGSNLKRMQRPSDDPIGNVDLLAARSKMVDNKQYVRNLTFAKAQLAYTESAVEELTGIVSRAKELAVGQASNFHNPEVRKNIAKEIDQLKNEVISIANRRIGSKYLFSGHKSFTRPFDENGDYHGDDNITKVEVRKDVFVPLNFSGPDIFMDKKQLEFERDYPFMAEPERAKGEKLILEDTELEYDLTNEDFRIQRTPASVNENVKPQENIIKHLQMLSDALNTNNHEVVQSLLPVLDNDLDRVIHVRTEIGSIVNSIEKAESDIEKDDITTAEFKSKIEDIDVAQLYTDLARQQNTLNATYKSSSQLMNNSLMKFLN